jgi:hypothetical protein
MTQLSLFGGKPLLLPIVRRRFLSERSDTVAPDNASLDELRAFDAYVGSTAGRRATETTLEQRFNHAFFGQLLGYDLMPGREGNWTLWPKPSQTFTALPGVPDAALGRFSSTNTFAPLVIVELKRPGTVLDAPQPSYGASRPSNKPLNMQKPFQVASG